MLNDESQVGVISPPAVDKLKAQAKSVSRGIQAETISVRIRWFGIVLGFLLVNLGIHASPDSDTRSQFALNGLLAIGVVYAILDTYRSIRGRIFPPRYRLVVSVVESLFIGLLCYFDSGPDSPFRFYYFLSLLVCAIRHPPTVTYVTMALYGVSYALLGFWNGWPSASVGIQIALTLVFLWWATWAIVSLTGLLKSAGEKLIVLNQTLMENQSTLEGRIRRRTKALQESQAMLVQQEKQAAFGLLAAGIAHEVGNPLAAISSIVQMLNKRNTDEYTRERLQMVSDQLTRIQKTLRELVGFSRPASQQARVVDVHLAINDALNIAKYYKRWKGKSLETDFAENLKPIRTVYDQLVQVVLNLIMNGLDATEEGATISVTTEELEPSGSQRKIAIRISDEGSGIPQEQREDIFEPYVTSKKTGTGLGLFVCRQLAEQQLGGTIELVRSDSAGTEFQVTIGDLLKE